MLLLVVVYKGTVKHPMSAAWLVLSLLHARVEQQRLTATASAAWVSDVAVEAASLYHGARGSSLPFWQAWAARAPSSCALGAMHCTLATLDSMELPPLERAALGAALAARVEAPKVEAWAALARTMSGNGTMPQLVAAPCWYVACGSVHLELADALGAAGSCAGRSSETDPGDADGNVPAALEHPLLAAAPAVAAARLVAVIDPHSAGLGRVLEQLAAVTSAAVFLRYRPGGASAAASSAGAAGGLTVGVELQGFGATARIKSSEYRFVDDRSSGAGDEEAAEEAEEEAEAAREGDGPSWLLRRKASEPIDGGSLSKTQL